MNEIFHKIASKVSEKAGHAASFIAAVLLIAVWLITGPMFSFSDTWQLVINTGTTIITFLMVFLIQNTQNRDARAMQLKLDELLESNNHASDSYVDLEDLSDEELDRLHAKSVQLHKKIERQKAKRQKP
ncbi:low affinity iron permease family protein [Candidatus Saccharibacteria bacterium]|nr:low affinity iron permease family protein [Candidatus Saccharibacteria bacterium]